MSQSTLVLPSGSNNGHEAAYRLTAIVPKRRYRSYLRERWWVVLVCVILTVGATLAYETLRPETYTSLAQLYLSGDVQLNTGMFFTEDSVNYYGTQIELLKSARLQGAAFDRAGITLKPGQKNPFKVDVFQPMKTSILVVQVTGPEPVAVQKLLQALLAEYLNYKKDTRRSTSEDLVGSLTAELAKREAELKSEQDKWADFQRSNNVAVLEEEGKSAGLYLADLNMQLDKLNLERQLLEKGIPATTLEESNLLPALADATGPLASPTTDSTSAGSDSTLKTARVELAVLQAERAAKTNELSELHPAMRKLNEDIARLQKTISALEDQDRAQRSALLQEVDRRIAAIQRSLPSMEAKVFKTDEQLSQSQRLRNSIQRQQGFYDHLLTMLQGVDLSKDVQQERLSILQDASPGRPTERYLALRLALAALGGVFLSLGLAFSWYLLDDRFVSVRDLQEQFGEPVFGLVPQVRVPRSKPGRALLEINDPRRAYAESYRHLRSALLLSAAPEERPQSLLFTAAAPAEGKTTIAINLARVLARGGFKVLLADMDPQAGAIHQLLGGRNQPGVVDFLRGAATAQAIVHPTDTPGLRFVPAGSGTDSAEDLFLSAQLEDLLAELRQDNDFIILDGAPVLASDNVALLVPHADLVLMVVRPFYTKSRLVRKALDMLYQRQAKRVAIVLNRARADDLAGHYAQNGVGHPAKNGSRVPA